MSIPDVSDPVLVFVPSDTTLRSNVRAVLGGKDKIPALFREKLTLPEKDYTAITNGNKKVKKKYF